MGVPRHDTGYIMRTIIRGTECDITPSSDYLCDWCDEQPATREGIEYRETYLQPAEWLGLCDECAGS
ncbi:hypothetical protein LCGC14_2945600 [marine sediment metagenome]|uniref:Uncharacterized protein n=1 Tax=marine sediment metagenome TaxID=412755 RepID=A0A0F8XHA0_9ZZZZ